MPAEVVRKQCPVLIAEDDPGLQKLLATALRRRRVEVETASNGEEAIRLLAEHDWLVLVLDLMMPIVSGFDVIAWLAGHPDRKPKMSLVVSAMDREVLQQLDPTVVNAIIFKPFDVAFLAAYVKTACELQHRDRRHARIVADEPDRSTLRH